MYPSERTDKKTLTIVFTTLLFLVTLTPNLWRYPWIPRVLHLVCSICILWASRYISVELSNLALSCSMLRSHISMNLVRHSALLLGSSRLFFPLRPDFPGFSAAFLFTPSLVLGLLDGTDFIYWDFIYAFWRVCCALCNTEGRTTFDGHFRWVHTIAMTHNIVK